MILPHSELAGEANILMMPNLDAANMAYQMIKVLADALPVGPILIGPARPAHILTPSVTARGILNMTAVAAVEAQERARPPAAEPVHLGAMTQVRSRLGRLCSFWFPREGPCDCNLSV